MLYFDVRRIVNILEKIMEMIGVLKEIKELTGKCSWGIHEDFCTAEELFLRQQYENLSTRYHVLHGLIPEPIDTTLS